LVLDGVAGIGISGPMPGLAAHPAIEPIRVGEVELVSVAAPKHPLAKAGRNLNAAVREHVQLVLSDRSELTKSVDFAVVSPRTWRLSDLGAKLLLLRAGIGWGNMPLPMVQEDLDSGSLVRLDPPGALAFTYRFEAIYRSDSPPGPAGSWLIERFRSQVTPEQGEPKLRRPTKPATLHRKQPKGLRKSRK
jgi:DNA-binding transcriptional LysR family regulator